MVSPPALSAEADAALGGTTLKSVKNEPVASPVRRARGQEGLNDQVPLSYIYIYTLYNHIFIVVDIDSVDTSVCRVMCPLSIVSTIDLDRCNILMMKFISRLHPHLQFQRILGDLNPSFYLLSQISVYVFFCPKTHSQMLRTFLPNMEKKNAQLDWQH